MRRFLLIFAALLALSSAEMVAAEPKIHALMIGDATPAAQWGKLQPNITLDIVSMATMLWENVQPEQLNVVVLTLEENSDARPSTILAALQELQSGPNDTLLVYYTGHGAADDGGHYFSLAGGKLYREDLKRRMQALKPRLAVLISDCCNVRSDGKAYFAPAPRINEPAHLTPVIESLLIKPGGVVDINGSSPGESAFFIPEAKRSGALPGSLFTKALTTFVRNSRSKTSSWDELLTHVSTNIHVAFRTGYPQGASLAKGGLVQHDQTVYAIEYPDMPEKKGPRTGVKVRDQQGGGAWIFALDAGSPATRVYDLASRKYVSLQPGQRIVAANGKPVKTAAEFAAIVRDSPQLLRFSLQSGDASRDFLMRLRY
jgi:hypothetical protein